MTSFRTQVLTVMRRDIARERRSGEVLWVTIPFGAIALLLVPLAIGTDAPMLRRIGPGLYWTIVMLFGVLISIRQSNSENRSQRDLVALTGLDPAAIFVGRAAASFVFLIAFEAILAVVTIVLYDVSLEGVLVLPVLIVIVGVGLSLLGTLAAGIVATGTNAAALVPLLVAPLSIPLLIGASQTLEALRIGAGTLTWTLLMIVTVLVLAIAGVLAARPLQETG